MFSKRNFLILNFFVLVLKCIFLFAFHPNIKTFEDLIIATNLVERGDFFILWDGIVNHSFQFPVYPSMIACVYVIFNSLLAICVLNCVLQFVAFWLLYEVFVFFTGKLELPNVISFVAAVISLFHPAIAYYGLMNVHPFSLDLCMLVLPIFFSIRYIQKPSSLKLILFSLSLGLAVLTRATLIVAVVPYVIYMLLIQKRFVVKEFSVLVIGVLLVCLPWAYRNYKKDGVFALTSSTGKILWKGSLPETSGSNYLANGNDYTTLLSVVQHDSLSLMSVKEQSEFFMKLFKQNKDHVFKTYLIKLKNFWFYRSGIGEEYSPSVKAIIPFYLAVYFILLILAVAATLLLGRVVFALFALPVTLSLIQAVFYVEMRHRILIEPILVFMACCSCFILIKRIGKAKESNNFIE